MNRIFEDAVRRDVETTFLAEHGEFTERVVIDGLPALAVREDSISYAARSVTAGASPTGLPGGALDPELPICDLVLHVRTSDLPAEIEAGGVAFIDDVQHFVTSRRDMQGGVTRLEMARMGY